MPKQAKNQVSMEGICQLPVKILWAQLQGLPGQEYRAWGPQGVNRLASGLAGAIGQVGGISDGKNLWHLPSILASGGQQHLTSF